MAYIIIIRINRPGKLDSENRVHVPAIYTVTKVGIMYLMRTHASAVYCIIYDKDYLIQPCGGIILHDIIIVLCILYTFKFELFDSNCSKSTL